MRKSTLFTLFMSILGPTLLTPVNAEEDLIYVGGSAFVVAEIV